MPDVKKVSEITTTDIAEYCHIAEVTTSETDFLTSCLDAAKAYICKYTGLTADKLDLHSDFVIVVYVLCEDMYDNRTLYTDNQNVNKVVENILSLHSINLL